MFKQVLTGAAVAVALGAAGSASAATYVSYLEWWDPDPITKAADPFRQVTIVEFDGYVEVTAELYDGAKFQKSGANAPFAFSLDATGETVTSLTPTLTEGASPYNMPAFGSFTNSFTLPGNGFPHSVHPIKFTVAATDMTFAGEGATFDIDGRLLTSGTGNQFVSNAGGWWFAGHIQPLGDNAESINVAAKDAFCVAGCSTGAVPEPDAWALMIMGFGAAGAMLRRRKYAVV